MKDWQKYQQDAADLFRSLGLQVHAEFTVEGARAQHSVDVYVTGSYMGINFAWVVECKAWSSNVPKEKVLALASVVQDTGADRGFLLSEVGFQSGAIRAAAKTNISLSSIADLKATTEEFLIDTVLGRLSWRLTKVQKRLREIKREKYDDVFMPPTIVPLAKIALLDLSIEDALRGDYPIIYLVEDGTRYSAASLDEFVQAADRLLAEAEVWQPP